MKSISSGFFLFFVLYCNNSNAVNTQFSIREITLGMPIQEACGAATIESSTESAENIDLDDTVKEMYKSAIKKEGFTYFDGKSCSRKLGVPEGIEASQANERSL